MRVDTNVPYSERKMNQTAAHIGRGVTNLTDIYVTGLNVMRPGATGNMWLDIGMAAGHAVFAIDRVVRANSEGANDYVRQKNNTWAFGEALQTAGYVGLAFGWGIWAVPILATGAVISNFAYFQ